MSRRESGARTRQRGAWLPDAGGWLLAAGCWLLASCDRTMADQGRPRPLSESSFFEDGSLARPAVAGTVPRGGLRLDTHLHQGRMGDKLVDTFPHPVDRGVLERGRERYAVFCSPCHDATGGGGGRVVQRGFRRPPSLHEPRLRDAPAGHFYDVITRGFGAMPDHAAQIPPADRWAIVAYVRALQLSQNARREDVPADVLREMERAP